MTIINTHKATRRAMKRGVDPMLMEPRNLRTTHRIKRANPNRVISTAWQQTFNTLGENIQTTRNSH
ncbi:hypothetical protein MA47_09755 [Corynebacterium auriscanis]|uniref:Transposase n=1 Tax=Corynebacterium auriscanis TaxID=99807 RepID=A0A0A2DMM4_9CORY|nr:hypothetical protein [Corynebacterium auriscanis]KGM18156.1 hypothetical protein MA47_09755 [Corynebacterium auriscanis]